MGTNFVRPLQVYLCERRKGPWTGPSGLLLQCVPGGSKVLSVEFDVDTKTHLIIFSSSESVGVWCWPSPLEEESLVRLDE